MSSASTLTPVSGHTSLCKPGKGNICMKTHRNWMITEILMSCHAWPAKGFKRSYTESIWAYMTCFWRKPSSNKSWVEDEISSLVSCSLQLLRGDLGLFMALFKPSQNPNLKYLNMLANWCFSSRGYGSISMWQHLGEEHAEGIAGGKGKGIVCDFWSSWWTSGISIRRQWLVPKMLLWWTGSLL